MNKKIVILTFSTRKNGNCAAIKDYIEQYYMRTNIYSYTIDGKIVAPCGNCDYQCLKPGAICPNQTQEQMDIMNMICSSDLVYFIVPNYCGYPCGNYFAFNERSVGYFNMDRELMDRYMNVPKRFIIVSNSVGDSFVNAMRQQANGEPNILYLQTGKYKKRSIAGDLLDSDEAKADLSAYLARE